MTRRIAIGVVLAMALTLTLTVTAAASRAKPITLAQAERIALRWGQQMATDRVIALWVSDCRRGGRADYAICSVHTEDVDVVETDPVVIWRLAHGYAVRLQQPTLFVPNRVWYTR